MKKLLFAALALFIMNGAVAQIKVGVKAGGNLSTLTGNDYAKMKFGFHVGGFAEFVITDQISIQPELLYSTQGTGYDDVIVLGIPFMKDASTSLGYINVPVLLKINFGESGFGVEVGPQVGFLVSAESKGTIFGQSGSGSIKDNCKTLDVTAVAGLSYNFAENFVVSARYGFGLTKVIKDAEDGKCKNNVISLSFGYKF